MAGCGLYPFVVGCLFSSSAETISEALTIIEFLSSNDEEFSIYVAEKSLLTVFSRMLMNDIDGDEINTPRVILTIFDGEIIAANKSSSEAEKQNLIRYPEDNYECVDLRSRSMAEQHNDCNQESDGEMENCSYSIEDKDFDRAIPSEEESELAEGCFIENRDIDYDCLPTVAPPSMQMEQEDKSQIECEAENFHCEGIKSSSKSILPCQIDISFQIPIFNWNERARIWSVMRTLMLNIFTHKNGFQSTEKYSKDSIEEKIVQPLNYSSTAPFDSQTIITVSSNSHSALSLNDFIQHRVIVALISTLEELASFQNKSDSSQLNFLPVNIFALQLLQTILILLRAGEEMLEKFNKMEEQKSMMQSSLDTNETTFINSFSSSSDESYDLFKNKPLCDLCLNYTNINTLNYFCRSKDKNLAEVANMICSRWIERVTTLVMCDSDSEWEDVIDSLITNG